MKKFLLFGLLAFSAIAATPSIPPIIPTAAILQPGTFPVGTYIFPAGSTIKVGTGNTSVAPFNIPAGTLTTTAVSGNLENNGTNLYYTNSAGTRSALGVSTSSIQASTATTGTGGTVSVTFSTAFASAPSVDLTAVSTSTTVGTFCQLSAAPTTTGFSVACFVSNTVVVGGTSVTAAAAGVVVHWIATARTQ